MLNIQFYLTIQILLQPPCLFQGHLILSHYTWGQKNWLLNATVRFQCVENALKTLGILRRSKLKLKLRKN